MKRFRANGKLLISGEYAVLDGALALAVPTRLGQSLEVVHSDTNKASPKLLWEAFLDDGELWFSAEFDLNTLSLIDYSNEKLANKLLEIFQAIESLQPNFFQNQTQDLHCKTQLEFPKDWGLGSSSTLIYLLAQWTEVDAFELNRLTFNTSGYDVACAGVDSPILYQIKDGKRHIEEVEFEPEFLDQLYFVHLNQKQDTQVSVAKDYKNLPKDIDWLNGVSAMTYNMLHAKSLEEFEMLMNLHEELIVYHLKFAKVKGILFQDYEGSVKSLGAWGGDFALVTARPGLQTYLESKGYLTLFQYKELIIN